MFRTWYKPLCAYANGFLRSRDEAEEVVQAVFIQFWEKRNNLEIEISLKSYLYRAVRNGALNKIKHEKVKLEYAGYAKSSNADIEAPSENLEVEELQFKIRHALMKLPEQCRKVFELSRFEELKYAEIAERLGISVKTVENQMGKALRIMREQLQDYLPLIALLMKDFL